MLLAPSFVYELREHLYQTLATWLERLSGCLEFGFVLVQDILSVDKIFHSSATPCPLGWCSARQAALIHGLRVIVWVS